MEDIFTLDKVYKTVEELEERLAANAKNEQMREDLIELNQKDLTRDELKGILEEANPMGLTHNHLWEMNIHSLETLAESEMGQLKALQKERAMKLLAKEIAEESDDKLKGVMDSGLPWGTQL